MRLGGIFWLWMAGTCVATTGCASSSSESGTGVTSVAVGGLSSRQSTVDLRNEASVSDSSMAVPLSTVWRVMPAVFERLEIEINHVDPGNGRIGNGNFRPRRLAGRSRATFLDCGSGLTGPYADAYTVTMSLLVQLTSAQDGTTIVRTVIDAYAEDRGVSARPIHCISRGGLERQIFAMIQEQLPA